MPNATKRPAPRTALRTATTSTAKPRIKASAGKTAAKATAKTTSKKTTAKTAAKTSTKTRQKAQAGSPAGSPLKKKALRRRPRQAVTSRTILATDNLDDIWKKYKRDKDPELRNFLIERHMPLVKKISERLLMTLPKSIELNDLISWGVFGLMDAIDGFDLTRGIKFKTYCSTRIRGAILDELRSQDWVPRLVRLKAHQINKAYKVLEEKYGREPTDFEMAKQLNISIKEYGNLIKESSPKAMYSLNEKWDEQQNDEPMEKIELVEDKNSSDPVEYLNQKDILMTITRSLARKEKLIIIMYYYEGLTMKEIGNILNLTESRVCQIHSNIVSKLKVQLDKVRKKLLI